jgi:hypothetical protein
MHAILEFPSRTYELHAPDWMSPARFANQVAFEARKYAEQEESNAQP